MVRHVKEDGSFPGRVGEIGARDGRETLRFVEGLARVLQKSIQQG